MSISSRIAVRHQLIEKRCDANVDLEASLDCVCLPIRITERDRNGHGLIDVYIQFCLSDADRLRLSVLRSRRLHCESGVESPFCESRGVGRSFQRPRSDVVQFLRSVGGQVAAVEIDL